MNLNKILSLSLLPVVAVAFSIHAAEPENAVVEKKVVVAVKTDDVELHEMDISHLQPGDSETIHTENGRTIDLLRTEDDVEIYIDGELLESGSADENHHRMIHIKHELTDIDCADEADCDKLMSLSQDQVDALDEQHGAEKVYIIRKEVKTN